MTKSCAICGRSRSASGAGMDSIPGKTSPGFLRKGNRPGCHCTGIGRGYLHSIFHRFQHISVKGAVSAVGANPRRNILENKPLASTLACDGDPLSLLRLTRITECTGGAVVQSSSSSTSTLPNQRIVVKRALMALNMRLSVVQKSQPRRSASARYCAS